MSAPLPTAIVPPDAGLLGGYAPLAGVYDEMADGAGGARAHYQRVVAGLEELGVAELKHRADSGRRLIGEQGITYNVYDDPRGMERPWQLDMVPFVIAPEEWRWIESALIQRATLLNRIMADCYGRQDLIRSGWLPPALVFSQPDFLRPAHGIRPPGGIHMHFYAADLARSPDGRWWVISDRTQIPTGAGYALANRLVTSRLLPEAFAENHVQRVAKFFREVQSTLTRLGSRRKDDPRVVLLTPGPYNETYFEQAYLARYLGYTLVEGQDLTVRDDRVFLKTLSGLEPVDVILRRVDDDFCDPLELNNTSILGVPGLLEAARAGNVAIANAIGCGLLQSPAFMAFLPGLCRHLLGEELQMPSVATWWCGQDSARRYVLENLGKMFVKPAFRSSLFGMTPERRPTAEELAVIKRRIEFQPEQFIGQEWVQLSTAPTWQDDRLVPRPVALRAYVVSGEGGYKVMAGGLARVSAASGGRYVSMQRGGTSKDTWVLSEEPVEDVTLLHSAGHVIELRRVGNNLPSRVADNFFWMGRYAARVDATARLLRSTLVRFSPESSGASAPPMALLIETMRAMGCLSPSVTPDELDARVEVQEAEVHAAIFDGSRPASLRSVADRLAHLGMLVRDRTANDLWRAVDHLDQRLNAVNASPTALPADLLETLNQTVQGIAAFFGLSRENMTRAQGWRFLDMGVRVERALLLAQFLRDALSTADVDNPSVIEAVLEVADSAITYRSRYNLLPNIAAAYDLVMLDDTNPRSLVFQLSQLVKHFERLPRERESALPSPAQRILIDCVSRVRLADPRALCDAAQPRGDSPVMEALRHVVAGMPRLSDAIAVSYFAHSNISRWGAA